jgi:hypothetical protein
MTMAKRVCKGSHEWEDVGHYVLSKFLEHPRMEELIEKGEAMKFMSGMMHLSFHSSTSPYHTLYRQKGRMHELYDKTTDSLEDDPYDTTEDTMHTAAQAILEEMQTDNIESWYRSTLFLMYVEEPNYSELSRKTGIPRTSISQAVTECREYIKKQLTKRL